MTESCLEACMGIKRTCLDEFPLGHPKMFERTVDIISMFVLAILNTINLFLILSVFFVVVFVFVFLVFFVFFVLSPIKTLGK